MAIYVDLVRHGETILNALGIYQGQSQNVSLSEEGRLQVRNLAQRLSTRTYAAIYSSPLKRAKETAEIIAATRKERLVITAVPELAELDHGVIGGMRNDEIQREYPAQWKEWKQCPLSTKPAFPGGQNPIEEMAKAMARLQDISLQHASGERILCVTHGAKIHLIILSVLGCPDAYHAISVPNCGMVTIQLVHPAHSDAPHTKLFFGEPESEEHQTPP